MSDETKTESPKMTSDQEVKETPEQKVTSDDFAAGFDIGTTTSCAAIWINDRVEIIPDSQTGSRIIPSYVSFTDQEKLVGDAAKNQSTMKFVMHISCLTKNQVQNQILIMLN